MIDLRKKFHAWWHRIPSILICRHENAWIIFHGNFLSTIHFFFCSRKLLFVYIHISFENRWRQSCDMVSNCYVDFGSFFKVSFFLLFFSLPFDSYSSFAYDWKLQNGISPSICFYIDWFFPSCLDIFKQEHCCWISIELLM